MARLFQADNLAVQEVLDGYIVYQIRQDRVHYLNKTAAIIFEFCDGSLETDDIVERVAKAFDLNASAHNEIRAALDSLIKERLIVSSSE